MQPPDEILSGIADHISRRKLPILCRWKKAGRRWFPIYKHAVKFAVVSPPISSHDVVHVSHFALQRLDRPESVRVEKSVYVGKIALERFSDAIEAGIRFRGCCAPPVPRNAVVLDLQQNCFRLVQKPCPQLDHGNGLKLERWTHRTTGFVLRLDQRFKRWMICCPRKLF